MDHDHEVILDVSVASGDVYASILQLEQLGHVLITDLSFPSNLSWVPAKAGRYPWAVRVVFGAVRAAWQSSPRWDE